MKTKFKFTLALGIMIIAIVTSGVPFGRQGQGASKPPEEPSGCYTEQEVALLMEAGQQDREAAIKLLELACENAIRN